VMLIGIALLALMAAPASAQWFVTPYVGGHFGGDSPDTKFNLGGGVGWLGGGIFGFEADFGYAPNFFEPGDDINFNSEANLTTIMFNAMAAAPMGARIRPYGSGGIGWMKSTVRDADDAFEVKNNDFGINLGGGILAQFNEHVGWRTDIRYFRAVVDPDEDLEFDVGLGGFDHWRATAGLTFSF
jgi:opacity protein-like surface antigen